MRVDMTTFRSLKRRIDAGRRRVDASVSALIDRLSAANPCLAPPISTPAAPLLKVPANVMLGSIVINLLGLALPLTVLQVYDRVIPNNAANTLFLLIAGVILCVLIELILRIARAYIIGWNAMQFSVAASSDALSRAIIRPTGDSPIKLDDQFRTLESLADRYSGQFRLALLDVPFVFLFLIVLALAGGALAVIPVATTILVAIQTARVSARVRSAVTERLNNDDKRYDFLNESLAHIETAKAFALESPLMRRAEALQRDATRIQFDTIVAIGAANNLGQNLANLTNVAIVAVGALFVIGGDMSLGALAACSLLAGRLIQPILRLASTWTDLQSISVELEACRRLFQPDESAVAAPRAPDLSSPPVSLSLVRFRTRDGERYGVHALTIKPGECVALSATGSFAGGALFEIINGKAKREAGDVEVFGLDPASDRLSLRASMSALPESPQAFSGSILDNLTVFGAFGSPDEAFSICRTLGLEQIVHSLPNGYDTDLASPLAETMHQGLAKMTAIARLFIQARPLALLKNPTAGLSPLQERMLARYLRGREKTQALLILTDSPILLAAADRVYSFEGGVLRPVTLDPKVDLSKAARGAA